MKKKCTKCKILKTTSCFRKVKSRGKHILYSQCSECEKLYKREYYQANKERLHIDQKEYRENNKEKIRERCKKWELENKSHRSEYGKQQRKEKREHYKQLKKEWCINNKDKHDKWRREYFSNYRKERSKNDVEFRLTLALRSRLVSALKRDCAKKSNSTISLAGCNAKYLRDYLESLFSDGMTWDNYGPKGWHIDHVRPCASFDLTDPTQQKKCFHYTNLQPLWWYDNLSKADKW